MTAAEREVPARFRLSLRDLVGDPPATPVVAAVSGGRDSVVLLHLLRFESGLSPADIVVAHFDHRMREGSAEDAGWVEALAGRLGVPYRGGVAETPISGEADARAARYAFLHQVSEEFGGAPILTAHHADDQAETVLFRVARGTGLGGLRGIRRRRADGVVRPLLALWGREIAEYAREHALEWRIDPTNATLGPSRNVLRHVVLPELERSVGTGVREALVDLARAAEADAEAWRAALAPHVRAVVVASEMGRIELDRPALLERVPELRSRVLRAALDGIQVRLGRTGTRLLSEFCAKAPSGASFALRGDATAVREYDRIVVRSRSRLARPPTDGPSTGSDPAARTLDPSAEVVVPDARSGSGTLRLSGSTFRVSWRVGSAGAEPESSSPSDSRKARFDVAHLAFPLHLRSRRPGDRIRLPGGTKKVKKLLNEARIGVTARASLPLITDAEDRVLWVPGVARSVDAWPVADLPALYISLEDT